MASSGLPNHQTPHSAPRPLADAVTEQPKAANGSGGVQPIVAPLTAHKPLSYDSDSDNGFGAAEFAAAEALASKNRIVKKGREGSFHDYPGPIHVS